MVLGDLIFRYFWGVWVYSPKHRKGKLSVGRPMISKATVSGSDSWPVVMNLQEVSELIRGRGLREVCRVIFIRIYRV